MLPPSFLSKRPAARAERRRSRLQGTNKRKRLSCEQLEDRRLLAITVNTLLDVNANDGLTTLREAIAAALPGETINFAPALTSGGAVTIQLSSLGELVIDKSLSIVGPGPHLLEVRAYDSSGAAGDGTRVFNVDNGQPALTTVSIGGLELTFGDVTGDGGAIRNRENLTLEQVSLTANRATNAGGAIDSRGANLTVLDSTIRSNSALAGGGIYSDTNLTTQTTTIVNSTISSNVATSRGGGIYNFDGRTILRHSTITKNESLDGQGAGVASYGDQLTSTEVHSSIIAGNVGSDVDFVTSSTNSFVSQGYNLIGSGKAIAAFAQPGDMTGVADPLLGPLNFYGGKTQSHAPLPASPAVNAGDPAAVAGLGSVPLFDQRGAGYGRVQGGRIDIGAFETNPATFTVDTLVDEDDGNHIPGDLSLREAIGLANGTSEPSLVQFSPALHGGTIVLSSLGQIAPNASMSIVGPGAALLTVRAYDPTPAVKNGDGQRIFNVFNFFQSPVLSIGGLTFTGGDVSGDGGAINTAETLSIFESVFTNNATSDVDGNNGGAIHQAFGTLRIVDSTILGNRSGDGGGGLFIAGGTTSIVGSVFSSNDARYSGGAIFNSGGALTISDSEISGNSGTFAGGGLYSAGGSASLMGVTVNGNTLGNIANRLGGGIYGSDTEMLITSSTISGNTAYAGGGILLIGGGASSISQTRIQSNTATNGGGLYNGQNLSIADSTFSGNSATEGGGLLSSTTLSSETTAISNSTFSGNTASYGGGILNYNGKTIIRHSTITANSSPSVQGGGVASYPDADTQTQVYSTIIAGNSGGDVASGFIGPNSFLSLGYNLVGGGLGFGIFAATGDQVGVAPLLGPLTDNGGPTLTHALLAGSPAINAGEPGLTPGTGTVPVYDQRGNPYVRIIGGRTDVGALEYTGTPQNYLVDILTDESDGNHAPGDLSLREAILLANGNAGAADTISFHPALSGGTVLLTLGALTISDPLAIDGPGADALRVQAFDPSGASGDGTRIFNVNDGAAPLIDVSIAGLTLEGADSNGDGGAIYNREQLSLDRVHVRNNRAVNGGGVATLGTLTMRDSTVSGNTANLGGGIVSVTDSSPGMTTIINSTLSGNVALTYGGGFYNFAGPSVIRHSTITANSAPAFQGGGIGSYGDTATLTSLHGSIVAGNTGSDVDNAPPVGTNSFQSLGYNLVGTGNGLAAFAGAGDQVGTAPLLGPLADNGGPTPTHALEIGSPAIDAGDPAAIAGAGEVPLYDQRGTPYGRIVEGDGAGTTRIDIGAFEAAVPTLVAGRWVFYNQSKFDGNTSGISTSDDLAIAVDKTALLPGAGTATFSNITSYSRGINGIMVDIADPAGPLTASDFTFKMSSQIGANNTPSTWQAAPAPVSVSVRPGAGVGGSDRVEIIWAGGAIANRWLEVIVEGNDATGGFNTNTGLAQSDRFYFGNRIGDTGSGTSTLAITSATDEIAARGNPGFGAAITNLYDFDRSGLVSAVDSLISRNNLGTLTKINIAGPPAAPTGLPASDDEALADAIAVALQLAAEPMANPGNFDCAKRLATPARNPREKFFAELDPGPRTDLSQTTSVPLDLAGEHGSAWDDDWLDGVLDDVEFELSATT